MRAIILLILLLSTFNISAQNDKCNCCSENHDDFDFWVGNWSVTDPNGNAAGDNFIEKIQNDCVIKENWTSAKGQYTGTSFNFYNSSTQQWEQVWVDSNGGNLYLRGKREGNKMILRSAELKNKKGDPYFHRITWTKNEDGTVRQFWETITNETEITVAFDGLYMRVQE